MTRNYAEEDYVKKGIASLGVSLGSSSGDVAQIAADGSLTLGPKKSAISGIYNVKTDYGAVGDGVADDTAAVLAAVSDATHGGGKVSPSGTQRRGVVYFPHTEVPGSGSYNVGYKMTAPIPMCDGLKLVGETCGAGPLHMGTKIVNTTTDVFSIDDLYSEMYIGGLFFYGGASQTTDVFPTMSSVTQQIRSSTIERCDILGFRSFMNNSVMSEGSKVNDNWISCNGAANGLTSTIHCVLVDSWMERNNLGSNTIDPTQYLVFLEGCGTFWFQDNFINPPTTQNPTCGSIQVKACKNGAVSGNQCSIVSAGVAAKRSQIYINTNSYNLNVTENYLTAALTSGDANQAGYITVLDSQQINIDGTIIDANSGGSNFAFFYVSNQGGATPTDGISIKNTKIRNGNATSLRKYLVQNTCTNVITDTDGLSSAVTYSASMTPDCTQADNFQIVATNGTAFTINAPLYPFKGKRITIDIKNSSSGALGTITWNLVYKLAGAFTNPADTFRRTISFYYDGTSWVETTRAAADI